MDVMAPHVGLQIEGVFYAFKMTKSIGDDVHVGGLKYVFTKKKLFCENNPLLRFIHLIRQLILVYT
jgi:hypothetical protein